MYVRTTEKLAIIQGASHSPQACLFDCRPPYECAPATISPLLRDIDWDRGTTASFELSKESTGDGPFGHKGSAVVGVFNANVGCLIYSELKGGAVVGSASDCIR